MSHPCALGPREVGTKSRVTQRVPQGQGPSSIPSAPCEPSHRDGGPSTLFYQRGTCSVALGQSPPS